MTKAAAREIARAEWASFLKHPTAPESALNHLRTFARKTFQRRAAFCPMSGEIDVLSCVPWPVYLPRTISSTQMEFRRADSREGLLPGRFGILEPDTDSELFALPFTEEDLLVIPALAVNEGRFRLGKGGGYYDRMRAALGQAVIAVVLPEILLGLDFPGEDHDLQVRVVITESGVR